MENLIKEIKSALSHDLYYIALSATLSLPDICGARESSDGIATKKKYINWFGNYFSREYEGYLNGEDCYYFRCSMLHQGSTLQPKSNYSRILFIDPRYEHILSVHRGKINDALLLNLRLFCNDMIEAVELWLRKKGKSENYRTNHDKFARVHPEGIRPYIKGIPVIS